MATALQSSASDRLRKLLVVSARAAHDRGKRRSTGNLREQGFSPHGVSPSDGCTRPCMWHQGCERDSSESAEPGERLENKIRQHGCHAEAHLRPAQERSSARPWQAALCCLQHAVLGRLDGLFCQGIQGAAPVLWLPHPPPSNDPFNTRFLYFRCLSMSPGLQHSRKAAW